MKDYRVGSALVALAMACCAQAHAADQPAGQQAGSTTDSMMSDIIVTAQRRAENLQKVPVAVTALSQDTLRAQAIYASADLEKAVPGLSTGTQAGAGNFVTFSIRGRGQNYGAAAGSVETYFADIPLSPPANVFGFQPQFFDLESVQALKGPQGTLFGRSTTGGAVLLVPHAPTDTFEGYARAQGGTHDNVQLEGAVNIPLVEDVASLRVAGFFWKRDGYSHANAGVVNTLTGQVQPEQVFNNRDERMVRATLLLKPAEGITNSTIVSYERWAEDSSPEAGLLLGVNGFGTANPSFFTYHAPGAGTFHSNLSVDLNRKPMKALLVSNTTTIDLTDTLTLKNIFGFIWTRGSVDTNMDDDGTPSYAIDLLPLTRPWSMHQYTDEVQLQGRALDGALDYTMGGMMDLTRQPGGSHIGQTLATIVGPGACPAVNGVTCNLVNTVFNQNSVDSFSLYASGTYKVGDRLSISAGFRHLWDKVSLLNGTNTAPVLAEPGAIAPTQVNPATLNFNKSKFQGNVWNIGLNYDVADRVMTYGGWRRGFKRGGFNLDAPSIDTRSFGPESVDDFYLGLKSDFHLGDMPVRFNIEGFYDFYKGNQVSYLGIDPVGQISTITTNVDKTTYRGFEFDVTADPTRWLNLRGSFSYTDAKNKKWIDHSTDAIGIASPVNLAQNPVALNTKYKFQVSGRLHSELPGDKGEISLTPTLSYRSSMFNYPFSDIQPLSFQYLLGAIYGNGTPININGTAIGANVVPAATQLDMHLEWTRVLGSRFDVALNVTNLTNKTIINSNSFAIYFGFQGESYAPPRMWTLEVSTKF